MLHKKKPHTIKIKQKRISYTSMLLNTALIGVFKAVINICKPGAIYGRKSNFVPTFFLEGCLAYQIYQVQYLQYHKPGFWGYKLIK